MTVFADQPARHDHTPTFTGRLSASLGERVTCGCTPRSP